MTIEKDIYHKLSNDTDVSGLVSSRIYPMKLPQKWTLPSITYQRISGDRDHCLDGPSGRARPRFQVDCWDDSYSGVKTLADKVRLCLNGFKGDINTETNVGGIILTSDRDIWEEDIGVYRITMDFIVPHFEATS